jgi:phosphotransferase system enzyme I (PtsI)
MFNLEGQHVLGILTEEGGLTSHAAILARAMRIPTLTGVEGLLVSVREGDYVIVDASEGLVRVNPEQRVLEQYRAAKLEAGEAPPGAPSSVAMEDPRTLDGEYIEVVANCGSLPEVEQAVELGMPGGLYRTELMYMVDKGQPSIDVLLAHYSTLMRRAAGNPVTFRLLHAESNMGLGYLYEHREANPALGCAGVRTLLAHEQVLRRQLQAILRAVAEGQARIAVPFVTDCDDLRRVREILFEERFELSKTDLPHADSLEVGVVVETPAAILGARDLAREADFLLIGLDSLLQHLLAADRNNHELSAFFQNLHPFVLRALAELVEVCVEARKPLSVFGFTAVQPHNTAFLLGVGLREFCVAPSQLGDFLAGLGTIDLPAAERAAKGALKSTCQAETHSLVEGFRHGYARP